MWGSRRTLTCHDVDDYMQDEGGSITRLALFIFDTPDRRECAGLPWGAELHADTYRLAGQGVGDGDFVVQAAQVGVHHHFQGNAGRAAASDYVFAVDPYQLPTAPRAGAKVLDLPGFLKRLTGQHHGLVWGGDIRVEDSYVAGVTQAGGAISGCH